MRIYTRKFIKSLPLLFLLTTYFPISSAVAENSTDGVWSDTTVTTKSTLSEQAINPKKFRLVTIDKATFDLVLGKASLVGKTAQNPTIFSIPMPGGGFERFEIVETQLMHPDLAAKFPEIKTYKGIGYDDRSAWIRFDWTPKGFHGYAKTSKGTVYIDPYNRSTTKEYISYFKRDFERDPSEIAPESPPIETDGESNLKTDITKSVVRTTGPTLPTVASSGIVMSRLRTAAACTLTCATAASKATARTGRWGTPPAASGPLTVYLRRRGLGP